MNFASKTLSNEWSHMCYPILLILSPADPRGCLYDVIREWERGGPECSRAFFERGYQTGPIVNFWFCSKDLQEVSRFRYFGPPLMF